MKYTCPCCGYKTLDEEPPGTYNICPICFWEDDGVQFDEPDFEGGANVVSLRQAQQNFLNYGASDEDCKKFARLPTTEDIKDSNWKPLQFHSPQTIKGKNLPINKKGEYEPLLFKQEYHALLVCGLIIFAIGVYLTFTHSTTTGHTRYGNPATLNGPGTLFISALFLIPWVGWTIKRKLKRKK